MEIHFKTDLKQICCAHDRFQESRKTSQKKRKEKKEILPNPRTWIPRIKRDRLIGISFLDKPLPIVSSVKDILGASNLQWEAVLARFVELAPSVGGTDKPVDAAVIEVIEMVARSK